MLKDAEHGKSYLDKELEDYMKGKGKAPAAEAEAEAGVAEAAAEQ